MAHSTAHLAAVVILLVVTSAKAQSRWSRQISSYTADISDWVPLSGPVEREPPLPPIKRQAVAEPRILSDPFRPGFDSLPFRAYYNSPANKQLYLHSVPSVPSAPQNYLTEQGFGQSVRFGLQQPSFPLSQGFVSTQFPHENLPQSIPQLKQRPQQIKMESFSKLHTVPSTMQVKYNQVPILKPFAAPTKKPDAKFVDGYRAENSSNDYYKKPQSMQKIKFENYEKPKVEQQSRPKVEREEVQLLYVPVESLNRGQFNFRSPLTSSQLMDVDSIYNQGPQRPIKTQEPAQTQKPINNFSGQNYFANFNSQLKEIDQVPKFSTLSSPFPTLPPITPVTLKPKKLKPHQPPLAIFLSEENGNRQVKVGDVLNSLKHANSVPVLDSVNPLNAPKVFIGPSSLQPLDRYVKFELPYLSNIENSDKKLRQLPFFVAPLSYNTPQGFAKIPFPSPHVGSVVINSQIKETKPAENVQPNYYTGAYRQEKKPVPAPQAPITHKPTVNYYTAAPNVNNQNIESNYYSFEPQTVSTLKPIENTQENIPPVRPDAFFTAVANGKNQNNPSNYYSFQPDTASTLKPLENSQDNIPPIRPGSYYDSQYNFAAQNTYPIPEAPQTYVPRKEITTTQKPITPTTKPPTTYPSQLLETHNPYSINQAFHFSTPLDYHTYYEDHKEQKPAATPGAIETPTQAPLKLSSTTAKVEEFTKKTTYQQTPSYVQTYSPEIQYESEDQNKYTTYNNEYNTKVESAETYSPIKNDNIAEVSPPQYTGTQETYAPASETGTEEGKTPTVYEGDQQRYEYNQYQTTSEDEIKTTSTTTTTRRPIRQRTRTRYTTTVRPESGEYSTRSVTRKPLRERRPLPTKRYEPSKATTEKATRKPIDYSSGETTTKSTRTRNRGRVTFRPNDNEQSEKTKSYEKKDHDLAYQRDVLHQNYPVTIQERMSTVDIEAMTEPSPKISTKNAEYETETIDTENAYTNEKTQSVNPFNTESGSDEDISVYPKKLTVTQPDRESTYVPRLSVNNDQFYQPKISVSSESYETVSSGEKEDIYAKPTTAPKEEPVYATESITLSEASGPSYSISNEYLRDETTTAEPEITTVASLEEEENIVQTTPSYNRVRVRPGVVKQYHQASSESPRIKIDRRRPVTYRPAFDKRRTTMRIDEIEADLKTKQVHGNHENEYKHPVYKPEPTTEASTQETSTKRGAYRRRRPSYTYTTTTTETSDRSTIRNKYEVKNRFRGRRPTTEKPTDKPEVQAEVTTTRTLHSRYSHRPRLSERYNKRPEQEETEDQEPNYSYNRPKYTEADSDIWSDNSFKPYNPNNILDEQYPTTERRSDKGQLEIITARNRFEDILISVTPATNNRNDKKIPDIPPTLEALVEQSKVTNSVSNDNMSTFETMLEEVMKSLEEQDENEYSGQVMKHKGGEIGEIPPERIITSGDTKTTPMQQELTTVSPQPADDATLSDEVNITNVRYPSCFLSYYYTRDTAGFGVRLKFLFY